MYQHWKKNPTKKTSQLNLDIFCDYVMLWLRIFIVVLWSAFLSWSCLQYCLENHGNVRQINLRCNNLFVTCHSIRILHHFFSCSKPANKMCDKKNWKKNHPNLQPFNPSGFMAWWLPQICLQGTTLYTTDISFGSIAPKVWSGIAISLGSTGDWIHQGVFDLGIPSVSVVCWRG